MKNITSKKINQGQIDYANKIYTKQVCFSKAVLWMTRQLSIPLNKLEELHKYKIETLRYIDNVKSEIWEFKLDDIIRRGEVKQVGQEIQLYFPIGLAKVIPIKKKEDNTSFFPLIDEWTISGKSENDIETELVDEFKKTPEEAKEILNSWKDRMKEISKLAE